MRPSVRFELGGGSWVAERDSVGFIGETDLGPVEFLITSEALAQMLDPEFESLDRETALETFIEFEPISTALPKGVRQASGWRAAAHDHSGRRRRLTSLSNSGAAIT